jgi:hypothetical protein
LTFGESRDELVDTRDKEVFDEAACLNRAMGRHGTLFLDARDGNLPSRCKNTSAPVRPLAAFYSREAIFQLEDETGWAAMHRDHPHAGWSCHRACGFSHISNFVVNHLT